MFAADSGNLSRETFVREIQSARETFGLPRGVLPFARDGGGSLVFLDLSPEGRGRVLAFVEGLPAWTGLRTESALVVLAPSFDAYVAMLRLDHEAVLEGLENAAELAHIEATQEFLDLGLAGWREHDDELRNAAVTARRRLERLR